MERNPGRLITYSPSTRGNADIEIVDLQSRITVEMADVSTSSRQLVALSMSRA